MSSDLSKPTVYIETTIPSLLAARLSRDLVVAGDQEVTLEWWEQRKDAFQLYISDFVIEEVSQGDPEAAEKRLAVLSGMPELEIDYDTIELAEIIMASNLIPARAGADAGHIAVATRYELDFLLTWNCRHIANAEVVRRLSDVLARAGYRIPHICTPRELLGGYDEY